MHKPSACAAILLATALVPAIAVARDHIWWPIHGPDANRIFVADGKATSVNVTVCARHLTGANAVEVLTRDENGTMIDDVMVIGDRCATMGRQFQSGQSAWLRLRRGTQNELPALPEDKGQVRFNVMPVNG